MSGKANKDMLIIGGVVVGGVVLFELLKGGIKNLTSNLNPLQQSDAGKALTASTQSNDAWNPNMWMKYGNPPGNPVGKLLYWKDILPVVQKLKSNFSWYIPFLDISSADAAEVLGAIQTAKNKAQFSQIVYQYLRSYGRSLAEDINKYLLGNMIIGNSPALQRVVDYVNSLPN